MASPSPPPPASFSPPLLVPTLHTARLVLRPLEPRDLEPLAELRSSELVRGATLEPPLPAAEARRLIARALPIRMRQAEWMITTAAGGEDEQCGFVALYRGSFGPHGVYAGFELLPGFWGRGIATEALAAGLGCGFDWFGLNTIYGAAIASNAASLRVMEKAGMKRLHQIRLRGSRPGYLYQATRQDLGFPPPGPRQTRFTNWLRRLLIA